MTDHERERDRQTDRQTDRERAKKMKQREAEGGIVWKMKNQK